MSEENSVYDFDPSGDEHPGHCMCPCCDLAEGKMAEDDDEDGWVIADSVVLGWLQ